MNTHSLQYYQNGQSAYRVLYSRKRRVLHDITCRHAYEIPYTEFDVLPKLTQKNIGGMVMCKECRRRMLVRSGMAGNERQLRDYLNYFDWVGASDRDLQRIVIEGNGSFTLLSNRLLEIRVHEDTWQIEADEFGLLLYHNNYRINEDGTRTFENAFHVQNDHGKHTFWNFARIITEYSFEYHRKIIEQKKHKIFCAKLKAELAIIDNYTIEKRWSIFFRYYSFIDYYDKHGNAKSRRNKAIHVISDKPCGRYAIVYCRVRKKNHELFASYMKYLKDRAFCECRADYVSVCEENLPQVG